MMNVPATRAAVAVGKQGTLVRSSSLLLWFFALAFLQNSSPFSCGALVLVPRRPNKLRSTTFQTCLRRGDGRDATSLGAASTLDATSETKSVALSSLTSSKSTSSSLSSNKQDNDQTHTEEMVEVVEVEFPPPLSAADRLKRSFEFYSTAVPVIASYYGLMGSIKVQELLGTELSDAEIEEMWNQQHEAGAEKMKDVTIQLKGFYVKTAQIISSRRDLFPRQYTDALSIFTDNVDPMPASLAKAVVRSELLHVDESWDDVFLEFDDEPLGAASVAQVHRAVLSPKYGGPREVAIKIQRPSIESKLLGDIANLKAVAKFARNIPELPLDYYTVFAELEQQLADEFDFVAESVAMDRIYQGCLRSPFSSLPRPVPLVMPRPVPGLVSPRVLVMDFLRGVPLSRAREEMLKRGIDPDSPESKLFARKLLTSLTQVFGRSILETGFFHADPHPGNIFVLDNGEVGLIDFGQVKQISGRNRETLCKIMIALDERKSDSDPEDLAKIGKLAIELGVELHEDAQDEAAAAVGMWLFDGTVQNLPGGYDRGELSPNSPVKELKSFPQDLVLVGRSSILIKGLSDRLGVPWSLASQWAPIARDVLAAGNIHGSGHGSVKGEHANNRNVSGRVRFRQVWDIFGQWSKGRAMGAVQGLPNPVRKKLAAVAVQMEDKRNERRQQRRLQDEQQNLPQDEQQAQVNGNKTLSSTMED